MDGQTAKTNIRAMKQLKEAIRSKSAMKDGLEFAFGN
jgi:hypothetical protein